MAKPVYVVTGGNRNIGFSLVNELSKKLHGDFAIILTSRNQKDGEEAVQKIGNNNVCAMTLDITVPKSCTAFLERVKTEFGHVNVLINNAGYIDNSKDGWNEGVATKTLGVNYFGTKLISETLLPIIKPNGRILHLSSFEGSVGLCRPHLVKHALADDFDAVKIDELASSFIKSVGDGTWSDLGFPKSTYCASKFLLNCYTRALARDKQVQEKNIFIAAVNPGWVNTRMNNGRGPRTTEEGAACVIWLALHSETSKLESGRLWLDNAVHSW